VLSRFESLTFRYIVPAVAALCLLGWCWSVFTPHFAFDDAESEILNQAWRLAQAEQLYKPIADKPFLHTAYTPLYFALTALSLKLTGLSTIGGKLISLLSALAIGLAFLKLGKRWHQKISPGFLLFCFLLLTPAFLYNLARVHVQMLAVALTIWALILLLTKDSISSTILAALLAVLALLTKQTEIALPIAAICWLALRDKRRLAVFAATFLALALSSFATLQWLTNGEFFINAVSTNLLTYDVTDIPLILIHWAGPLIVVVIIAAVSVWARLRERSADLLDVYFIGVVLQTILTSGRLGAHSQYVVELCVVTFIIVLRQWPVRPMLIFAQALLLIVYAPLFVLFEEGGPARAASAAANRVYSVIRTVDGPVLSQQGSFSLFTRGEIAVQLFQFSSLSRLGLWDQTRLLSDVESKRFAWVITEFDVTSNGLSSSDRERFTPELIEAIRKNYIVRQDVAPYFILRPKVTEGASDP